MKTIKIIDLLNKIANGEAPRKIKVTGNTYEFDDELNFYYTKKDYMGIALGGVSGEINLIANAFNDIVEILDEEDEFEDIEEITLEGQVIGYGILSKWLGSRQTDKEKKLCSAIECLGTGLNVLIKNQKKIIERLKEEE